MSERIISSSLFGGRYKLKTPEYRARRFFLREAEDFILEAKFMLGGIAAQGNNVKATLDFDTKILKLTLHQEDFGRVWSIADGQYLVRAPDGEVSVMDGELFFNTFRDYE